MHGIPQAINTGDTLFSLSRIALHRLTDLGFSDAKVLRLMRLYDETCLALCEGQYIDIATSESDELMSVDGYLDMIGRKTAALIAGSIEAGALLATDDEAVIGRYRRFGWALGLAFQINDDLLGIWGAERSTGKEPSDVAHKKKTLPVIYAAEHAGPEDRERLLELYADARTQRTRAGRDRPDPRARRCPRLHARPGPTLPRRGPRRARCRGRGPTGRPSQARADHRRGDLGLARASAVRLVVRGRSGSRVRTTSTLPTRRPSVVSTVSVSPSTDTWSPGFGTPPMR